MANAAIILVLLLGIPAASPLPAMEGAAGESIQARVDRLEALLRVARERVRMAESDHAAPKAAPAPDGWAATALADAARFDGEANLKVRQAEAALAEADLHEEQCRMFAKRSVTGRGRLPFRATIQLCRQRAEKAEGAALLAVQGAQSLAAKSASRLAMAKAMARCADHSASRTDAHLQATLAACEGVVTALEAAESTFGVHLEFLEAQEADFNRVLGALLPAGS